MRKIAIVGLAAVLLVGCGTKETPKVIPADPAVKVDGALPVSEPTVQTQAPVTDAKSAPVTANEEPSKQPIPTTTPVAIAKPTVPVKVNSVQDKPSIPITPTGGRAFVTFDLDSDGKMETIRVEAHEVKLLKAEKKTEVVLAAQQTAADGQVSIAMSKLGGQDALVVSYAAQPSGAPQYEAYSVTPAGFKKLDFYALVAPVPAVATGPYVVVSKGLNSLWHYDNGHLVKAYRVATGRDVNGPDPTATDYMKNFKTSEGRFLIDQKVVNPPYSGSGVSGHPAAAGGSANNPLGTRWMGFKVVPELGSNVWGIHGTNEPNLIGQWVSDGCIRMHTREAEALFQTINTTTPLHVLGI